MISTTLIRKLVLPAVLAFLVIFPSELLSQNREKIRQEILQLWSSVERAREENLPATELSHAKTIYALASNIDSYQDMMLSAQVVINASSRIDWRNREEVVKELMHKTNDFKDSAACGVYKTLMLEHSSAQTKVLWRAQVLGIKDLIKKEERKEWSRVIESQSNLSNYKNLSLYEFVLLNMINSMDLSDFNNYSSRYFRPVIDITTFKEFMKSSNFLFAELLAQQENNPNNYLISKLKHYNTKNILDGWRAISQDQKKEYQSIIEQYREYSNVTLFVAELATITENELMQIGSSSKKITQDSVSVRYKELLGYCKHWVEKHPKGLGTPQLESLIKRVQSKSIISSHANQVYPQREFHINVFHKNVANADLSIYKVIKNRSLLASAQNLGSLQNVDSLLKSDALLFSKKQYLFNNNRFALVEHDSIAISLNDPGVYIFKVNNSELTYISRVYSARLAVINRKIDGEVSLYATNFYSGEPVKEAEVTFVQEVRSALSYIVDSMQVIHRELYRFDGFTPISPPQKVYDQRDIYYKAEEYGPYTHLYLNRFNHNVIKINNYAQIFFDRSLYRPGDTLFYKIILYNSENEVKVNSNDKAQVLIRDSKHSIVETKEIETNEFGSTSGFFVIGHQSSNGLYSLEVNSSQDGNSYNSSTSTFRVEEYKRDSFYIITQEDTVEYKLEDSITLKGSILSYSGFPLAGAQISYTIASQMTGGNTWQRFGNRFTFGSSFSSATTSDSLGNFSIPIIFTPDSLYKQYGIDMATYNVEITATSSTSESNTSYTTLYAGELQSWSNIIYDKIICAQQPTTFKVESHNIKGENKLQGSFEIFSQEPESVVSGEFQTWEEITLDLSSLSSGNYSFVSSIFSKSGQVQKDSVTFSLFHLNDSTVPNDSKFFFFPLKEKDDSAKIHFLAGTWAEKVYTLVELIDGRSVVYKKMLEIEKGLHNFSIEIPSGCSKEFTLSLTTVIDGQFFTNSEKYNSAKVKKNRLKLNITNLRKKYLPNQNQSFTLSLRDSENRPFSSSELMVSIYDKTTEKFTPNSFDLQISTWPPPYQWFYSSSSSFSIGVGFGRTLNEGSMIESDVAYGESDVVAYSVVRGNSKVAMDNSRAQSPALREDQSFEFRKNFKETLLFEPQLYPNSNGEIEVNFNTSQLLSTFKILALAHDKKLNNTTLQDEFIVKKELMILSNVPAFVREGDLLYAQSMAVNLTASTIEATCRAYIGSKGERELGMQKITLLPGEQKNIEWKLNIPKGEIYQNHGQDSLKFRIMLVSNNSSASNNFSAPYSYSDGEEHIIRVLPSWADISQVKGYTLENKGVHKITIPVAPTLENALFKATQITISSPMEILSKELEAMVKPKSKDLFSYLGALYAQAFFKDPALEEFRKEAFSLFNNLKDSKNFYSWFPGMNGNYYLTYLFLDKIDEIGKIGQFNFNQNENELLEKTVKAIDSHFMYVHKLRLERVKEHKSEFIPAYFAIYMRVRALYPQFEMSDSLQKTINLYLDTFEKSAIRSEVMENAYVAAALYAHNREFAATRYLTSIKEYAVKNDVAGHHFPNAALAYRGLVNNQITAHSFLLNLFATAGDNEMVTGIAKWILLQKENQYWDNGLYMTDATTALMNAHILEKEPSLKKAHSKTKFRVDKKSGVITIKKYAEGIEFLYISHNYAQKESSIKSYSNGLSIDRTFYKVVKIGGTEKLMQIEEGHTVSPGDVIEIALTVKNSESRSYVAVKSTLPASFVPINEKSSYLQSYYREVKSSVISYYFDFLPQGTQLIKERFIVNNKGIFSTGIPKVKSLFAPAYQGNGTKKLSQSYL